MKHYSQAHVLLDAVQFTIDAHVPSLRPLIVANPDTLTPELVLRIILTYLPESTEPANYVGLVDDVVSDNLNTLDEKSEIQRLSAGLSDDDATEMVGRLRLAKLAHKNRADGETPDLLNSFLLARAHRIDRETGSIILLQQLLEPFLDRSPALRTWIATILLPILRCDYEYHPENGRPYTLKSFEALRGSPGAQELLSHIFQKHEDLQQGPGRHMRGVVGPWVYGQILSKRRKLQDSAQQTFSPKALAKVESFEEAALTEWSYVNEWLLNLAKDHFLQAAKVIEQWDGPEDIDLGGWLETDHNLDGTISKSMVGYCQAAMGSIYLCEASSNEIRKGISSVLSRVALLSDLPPLPDFQTFELRPYSATVTGEYLGSVSKVHLLPSELNDSSNMLTRPSSQALDLAFLLLVSASLLSDLSHAMPIQKVLGLCLFGLDSEQRTLLRKMLGGLQARTTMDDKTWSRSRSQLLWLRDWNDQSRDQNARRGVLCQIGREEIEIEILKTLLSSGRYKLASEMYFDAKAKVLTEEQIENATGDAALQLYDNASNGNKTRGGVKKASEIIAAFGKHFPASKEFRKLSALIAATHSLSFYSLTLQHGVSLLPANIRAHPDPLSLIDRVLASNKGSYTKLDDLIEIGRNFARAGLTRPNDGGGEAETREASEEERIAETEHSVITKAIEASLSERDFDTAYSYVVNRLSTQQADVGEMSKSNRSGPDDILWKAAYHAGRYDPKNGSGPSELRRLEQKMELLSQALLLAPTGSLGEVLKSWRKCEKSLNDALAKESEEEERWNKKGDRRIPGGFTADDIASMPQKPRESTRQAMNEEAPMGLFDVARGAASALSKSAFPLRGQRQQAEHQGVGGASFSPRSPDSMERDSEGRVRKRDMVSSMVTGGLASGIGWVLGESRFGPLTTHRG